MFFGLIFLAATTATSVPAAQEPTADALQSDLQTAYSCKDIDGRKVWKGGLAYYIQSFVYDDGTPDDAGNMATDAVLPGDNSAETMQEFEQACLTMAPTASTSN
ncbi:hypothetical protein [Pararhizobium sp. PWRC1-1]|uniref:hypothetical protein n=1 Tax=Pararhizobium sp. PWRC1-1 TaxID=2804566 RepID=UPI003CFA95A2